jgi:nucleoside 2-deoxyribosyltransferase
MKIYLASSAKNQHAVEMLTSLLEQQGFTVLSFVKDSRELGMLDYLVSDTDEHCNSRSGVMASLNCVESIMESDLVLYIGPAGVDSWAEIGLAYGLNKKVYGLKSKGEEVGIHRHMVSVWHDDYRNILVELLEFASVNVARNLCA